MEPIATKLQIISQFDSLNTKQATLYGAGNSGPGLRQVQQCSGVISVNCAPTPSLIIESLTAIHM